MQGLQWVLGSTQLDIAFVLGMFEMGEDQHKQFHSDLDSEHQMGVQHKDYHELAVAFVAAGAEEPAGHIEDSAGSWYRPVESLQSQKAVGCNHCSHWMLANEAVDGGLSLLERSLLESNDVEATPEDFEECRLAAADFGKEGVACLTNPD